MDYDGNPFAEPRTLNEAFAQQQYLEMVAFAGEDGARAAYLQGHIDATELEVRLGIVFGVNANYSQIER